MALLLQNSLMFDSEELGTRPEREQDIYQRVKLLGSGSFGRAYLVREIKTDQLLVIKQIDIADLDQRQQEAARKEAKILELLDHPNIVRFKEVYGTSKMKLNIVMEYADGGDLAARIQQAKAKEEHFSEGQILSWFTQICLGIKHIHDRKIIHRDLKGQNIFLTEDSCVKIGDFGVAKVLEQTLAKAKTVVGSPYYLSPEIIENRPYSFKTDIWSLGAILFQMCALNPPFTANNIQFLALKIVKGSFANIPPQYSNDLRHLIKWMLNTNPNLRPTINQILSSPIINQRIRALLTESQNMKQFSPAIACRPELSEMEKLRPPPNLLQLQQQNQSQQNNVQYLEAPKPSELELKAKTPNVPKKAPMRIQKKRPPISGHRLSHEDSNLGEIMRIKATPLENHQPPVKLPKVSAPAANLLERKRPSTPKIHSARKEEQPSKNITDFSAFGKKKKEEQMVAKKNSEMGPRAEQKNVEGRSHKKESMAAINTRPSTTKPPTQQHPTPVQPNTKPNLNIRKHVSKPNPKLLQKAEKKQIKLEIKSEEVKEREEIERDRQRKQKMMKKKANHKNGKNKREDANEPSQKESSSKESEQNQMQLEVEEQEKCNFSSENYEGGDFHRSGNEDDDSEDSLQLSHSLQAEDKAANSNYRKMLGQMEIINKLVEMANGKIENLPMLGSDVPELLNFSDDLRVDDSDLEFLASKVKQHSEESTQQVNLICLTSQEELENLRIALEDIFGLQNLMSIYKHLELLIDEKGLDFNEQQVIRELLTKYPQLEQGLLRRHFRMIVTVIGLENEMHRF